MKEQNPISFREDIAPFLWAMLGIVMTGVCVYALIVD